MECPNAMKRSHDALAPAAIMGNDTSVQVTSPVVDLSDRFKGVWYGRQLSETVDNFLLRLPPATTEISNKVPWIWIANPYEPVHAILEELAVGNSYLLSFFLNHMES